MPGTRHRLKGQGIFAVMLRDDSVMFRDWICEDVGDDARFEESALAERVRRWRDRGAGAHPSIAGVRRGRQIFLAGEGEHPAALVPATTFDVAGHRHRRSRAFEGALVRVV